jgi:hypothetical protein
MLGLARDLELATQQRHLLAFLIGIEPTSLTPQRPANQRIAF